MSEWSVNLTTLFLGRLRPPKGFTSTKSKVRPCLSRHACLKRPQSQCLKMKSYQSHYFNMCHDLCAHECAVLLV